MNMGQAPERLEPTSPTMQLYNSFFLVPMSTKLHVYSSRVWCGGINPDGSGWLFKAPTGDTDGIKQQFYRLDDQNIEKVEN